jgi:hypothetical protein
MPNAKAPHIDPWIKLRTHAQVPKMISFLLNYQYRHKGLSLKVCPP